MSDVAEPVPAALAAVERSIARLAAATLDLARSHAWNDVLATIDRLAALLGADIGPGTESVTADVDPAEIGRFVAGWVESLLLPEYLEAEAPGRAQYRVRLPDEARADGLGDLADLLESLGLRLGLSVEGDTARLSMAVGSSDRAALSALCAPDRLELDLDLDATRGALRHIVSIAGRVPATRRAAQGLELEELSGVVRFSFSATDGRMRMGATLLEPLRITGRTDDGPLRIEIGASELLAIEGEAGGTLIARVEIGGVTARLPASILDSGESGAVEYQLAGAGGELRARRGSRGLDLRRLNLAGRPAVARRNGTVVARVEFLGASAGFDLEPLAPGHFVIAPEGELSLRFGAAGREVTFTLTAGTRLETLAGSLGVKRGRLVLDGAGATAPIEVGEGRSLLRRQEPRVDERHPVLRFYESAVVH